MLEQIGFILAMVGVIVGVGRLGRWSGVPDAVLLTLVGLAYAALPGPTCGWNPTSCSTW